MIWIWVLLTLVIITLAIWELWVCEGTHLGKRFVIWMYDLAAVQYDRIKGFDTLWERQFLGEPVVKTLGELNDPKILDVGAGTGRLARSVFQIPDFESPLICLEPARRMIRQGRMKTPDGLALWVQGWADPLPFPENAFDLVSLLEVLEFTPHPDKTLRELARVLRPGGWLLITNRVGREAPWILGKTQPREEFPEKLEEVGFTSIETFPWQMDYDLIWAQATDPS
jgi:ubiquinone/menaquinone biosynthesis C-methylase UbiE